MQNQIEVFLRITEIICGLFYLFYGVNGFFQFVAIPSPSERALEFLKALDKAQFIMPSIKIIEIVAGFLFLFSFHGALAWLLMSPIVFNILGYQWILNKKEKLLPILILFMHLVLYYKYFDVLKNIII